MEQDNQSILTTRQLENFFLNQNIEIDFGNFFVGLILSLILAYCVKLTYIKVGRALNDKDYFSDTFIPLALITTLVITVIKFSLALSLGLVGALSIVRFRAAIKEPEELGYLFLAISVGLGFGADQVFLTITAFFSIVFILVAQSLKNKKFVEKTNMHLILKFDKEAKLDLNIVIDCISKNVTSLDLKRFDENNDFSEISFIVDLDNYKDIDNIKNELLKINSSVKLSFIDNKGLV